MEKEQIISTIKEKVGTTNLSDKTIGVYVDTHQLSEGTEPDDAYWENATKFLQALQGQYNHDVSTRVTEQTNEKFEEFKKKYVAGLDKKQDEKGSENESELQKQIAELLGTVNGLKAEIDNAKTQRTQKELMDKVRSGVKGKGADNEAVLDIILNGVKFDTEKSVDDLVTEYERAYNAQYKKLYGDGAGPKKGGKEGVHEDKEAIARREAFKARMRNAGRLPQETK